VLRVDPRGRVAYSVLRDTDPLIGASELAVPPAAQRALDLSVATLTAPDGGSVQDQGRSLAQFGIGYVLLPAPIDPALARLLDGVPGLRPVSQTAAFDTSSLCPTRGSSIARRPLPAHASGDSATDQ